jgi:hypothetical protein
VVPRVALGEPGPGDHVVVEEEQHLAGRGHGAGRAGGVLAAVLGPHRLEAGVLARQLPEELQGAVTRAIHDHHQLRGGRVVEDGRDHPGEQRPAPVGRHHHRDGGQAARRRAGHRHPSGAA